MEWGNVVSMITAENIQKDTQGGRKGQKSDAHMTNTVISTANKQHITETAVNNTAEYGYKFQEDESINKTFKIKTSESIPSCISRNS
jgi:hypothetical protein